MKNELLDNMNRLPNMQKYVVIETIRFDDDYDCINPALRHLMDAKFSIVGLNMRMDEKYDILLMTRNDKFHHAVFEIWSEGGVLYLYEQFTDEDIRFIYHDFT